MEATLHMIAPSLDMFMDELPQMPRLSGYSSCDDPTSSRGTQPSPTAIPELGGIPTVVHLHGGVHLPDSTTRKATVRRYIELYEYLSATGDPTHLYINGKRLTNPVIETSKSGSTEIWEVINLTEDNQLLHIHLALHLASFRAIKVREMLDLDSFKPCMTKKNDAIACDVTGHAKGKSLKIPSY
ncbi:hypothetical protein NL676_029391 [Syzygium grande]|nr:hypothetical protein NL676_029391 [Syzygium grande]